MNKEGLADAFRSSEQKVLTLRPGVLEQMVIQVVIVDRHRDFPFGVFLTSNVEFQMIPDFHGVGECRSIRHGSLPLNFTHGSLANPVNHDIVCSADPAGFTLFYEILMATESLLDSNQGVFAE